jgi:ribosomal protein L11 methyltransferase
MKFYYTRLQVLCDPDFSEILMAEIAEAGFDTFMEIEKGFEAYGEEKKVNRKLVESIQEKYAHVNPLLLLYDQVEKENWNTEWEKNVEPIFVDDNILVRASFHKIEKKYLYEIIITPKMSFGTGHHQTTWLMLRNQLHVDHNGKQVMDAGCGTAILAIMATKLGAARVDAFDIDEWSVENGNENVEVNKAKGVTIRQGTIRELKFNGTFNVILANINKNVLLDEMKDYSSHLGPSGQLLISGFYEADIVDLLACASRYDLTEERRDAKEGWACLLVRKGR